MITALKINNFSGADGFYGYRLGLELMTSFVPLLTLGWLQLRHDWSRVLAVTAAWLQFAILLPGAVVFGLFVPQSQVWSVSALAVAVREATLLTGFGLLVFVVGTGVTIRVLGIGDRATTSQQVPDEREGVGPVSREAYRFRRRDGVV